jgi:hypothetical protein
VTVFADWAPVYAEHGIATFPIGPDKTPLLKGYLKVGTRASRQLTHKFASAPALGFACGPRNGLTVLDVDTQQESVLADALDRHGDTPLIVRTGGGYHAYYRHNGERRRVRPEPEIDILGGGFAIAAPSRTAKGIYQIVRGSLDQLCSLPTMRAPPSEISSGKIITGRADALWRHCMRQARHCDTLEDLTDVATTFASESIDRNHGHPFTDTEIKNAAESAWKYTQTGQNRFGQHGAWLSNAEIGMLMFEDQRALLLLAFLRSQNGPNAEFWIANGLAEKFGWAVTTLSAARKRLVQRGNVVQLRKAYSTFYGWP